MKHSLFSRLTSFTADKFDLSITDQDVFEDVARHGVSNRLLQRYTPEQVRDSLIQYGVWDALKQ